MTKNIFLLLGLSLFISNCSDKKNKNQDPFINGMWIAEVKEASSKDDLSKTNNKSKISNKSESLDLADEDKEDIQVSSEDIKEIHIYNFNGNEVSVHFIQNEVSLAQTNSVSRDQVQTEMGTFARNKDVLDINITQSSCLLTSGSSVEYKNGNLAKKAFYEIDKDLKNLKVKTLSGTLQFRRMVSAEENQYKELLNAANTGCYVDGKFKANSVQKVSLEEFSEEELSQKL